MKSLKNPDIYWKIRELAGTARATVGELLREAGVSTSTVHQWARDNSQPRASTIKRINEAAARLRERNQ